MTQSLDKVLQPDGTYKWELVELRAENLYEKDKPASTEAPRKFGRKAKDSETLETPGTEF